jgi:hypothetical protein
MEIRPADLGRAWQLALIEQRAAAHDASTRHGSRGRLLSRAFTPSSGQSGRPGPLGRFWARGTGFNDREAAEAVRRMGTAGGLMVGLGAASAGMAAQVVIILAAHGPPVVAAVFGTILAALLSAGLTTPGILLRRWSSLPVSQGEVEALLADANDDLERSYLSLIRDALRREAAQLRTRANEETDEVTAASLSRQAEARERSADAAERSSLVLRRTAALRDELAAQTEALRLGLAALYSGAGDAADLSHLAATVRGVADEANAVADARAELDTLAPSAPSATAPVTAPTPMAEARAQAVGRNGS